MSRTRQAVRPRAADARNSPADANDSTAYPANRTRRLRARRTEKSSSTIEIMSGVPAIEITFSGAFYVVAGTIAYRTLVQYRPSCSRRFVPCIRRDALGAGAPP